ncbi:carboxymuconolactone decarboxylase family protein [Parvibaculum sp. MBR-TMA-1.3b-4.2]|jgi:AhpD family alkylhydroperoxidase
MKERLDGYKASPDAYHAILGLQNYVNECGLEHSLMELVKIRASQINGCAYCLHMHTRDARKAGESDERMHLLAAWRESPLFTERERAALAWTEALTLVSETEAPDEVYEGLRAHFSEKEIVDLSTAIGTINVWNRLAIGLRTIHPVSTKKAA